MPILIEGHDTLTLGDIWRTIMSIFNAFKFDLPEGADFKPVDVLPQPGDEPVKVSIRSLQNGTSTVTISLTTDGTAALQESGFEFGACTLQQMSDYKTLYLKVIEAGRGENWVLKSPPKGDGHYGMIRFKNSLGFKVFFKALPAKIVLIDDGFVLAIPFKAMRRVNDERPAPDVKDVAKADRALAPIDSAGHAAKPKLKTKSKWKTKVDKHIEAGKTGEKTTTKPDRQAEVVETKPERTVTSPFERPTSVPPVQRDPEGPLKWQKEHDAFLWFGVEDGTAYATLASALGVRTMEATSRYRRLQNNPDLRLWEA